MSVSGVAIAEAAMLIRKPVSQVFEAFINPEITSKFWFTKGSGRVESGKKVVWEWEMYKAKAEVNVKIVETDKRIVVEWLAYGTPTDIEWIFTPRPDDTTFVQITNRGFKGSVEEIIKQVISSTEGFTIVLAGLKALLEHGISLNLVGDRFPPGIPG
jgi:uncharacterized protein YndB with AHSA1/START domain